MGSFSTMKYQLPYAAYSGYLIFCREEDNTQERQEGPPLQELNTGWTDSYIRRSHLVHRNRFQSLNRKM